MNPRWQKLLKEYVEALAVALILALVIRSFVVQAFKIPSESMVETLLVGDHLLVSKFAYGVKLPFTDKTLVKTGDPERGDVIVFEYPENRDLDYIKRIIGIPGDVIELKNNVLYRNGQKVDEPYKRVEANMVPGTKSTYGPITVPEGQYFVMGDNRDHSQDSRYWGFVPREYIRGKAWVIYWSWAGITDIRWNRVGNIIH
ncbi:signal peptidase I [Fundidesulfovibrio terrae]|uniref:signal peptidase I n=1 Tax=Fundidesulfovibrio terrae TaxID=2922866 RepID=UPI001FAF0642|nr:signal peptidase I [Fundidesulfovibrio terrae]